MSRASFRFIRSCRWKEESWWTSALHAMIHMICMSMCFTWNLSVAHYFASAPRHPKGGFALCVYVSVYKAATSEYFEYFEYIFSTFVFSVYCPSLWLTWYSRSCLAMSCLALCSASSRSLVRALASFTASSPRSSASASWFSRPPRWGEDREKKSSMLDLNHPESYNLPGCIFPVALPALWQPLSRSAAGWSVGWPRPLLPSRCGARLHTDWPAPTFGRTTERRKSTLAPSCCFYSLTLCCLPHYCKVKFSDTNISHIFLHYILGERNCFHFGVYQITYTDTQHVCELIINNRTLTVYDA